MSTRQPSSRAAPRKAPKASSRVVPLVARVASAWARSTQVSSDLGQATFGSATVACTRLLKRAKIPTVNT